MNQSFFARRGFLILVVMTFLLPFIWMGTKRALRSNRNDVKDWLPARFEETAQHGWFQKHFPYEQFVLCSWEGCTLDDQRLELLAKKLVPAEPPELKASPPDVAPAPAPSLAKLPPEEPRYFRSVLTGARLAKELQDRYPELSEEEILKRLEGSVIGKDHYKTCLLVTLTEEAKGKNLRNALEKIRELARQCNIEPPVEDNRSRNVFVRAWDSTIVAIREGIFGLEPPGKGLRMGGPPVDNVAIDVEGERSLYRLAAVSAIVGLGMSWWCLRSWKLTAIVFSVAILSAGISLALVWVSGTRMNAILLTMPSLVYVAATSGAIHLANYYRDAVRRFGLHGAADRAVAGAWLPLALAAGTTAIGLASLAISELAPIRTFGIFSALGVMASLVVLCTFMPAVLEMWPVKGNSGDVTSSPAQPERSLLWNGVGEWIVRHNGWVTLACLVVMAVGAYGVTRVQTSVKLMRLFSPKARIIHDYAWLEEHLGPLVPMEVVLKFDNQDCHLNFVQRMRLAQDVETAMEGLKPVGGALSAATFAPDTHPITREVSGFERLLGLNRKMQQRLRDKEVSRRLEKHRNEFRDYLTIDGDPTLEKLGITGQLAWRLQAMHLDSLKEIEQYGDCQQSITVNLASIKGISPKEAARVEDAVRRWQTSDGVELWRITARVPALTDLDYNAFVHEIRGVVEPVLAAHRAQGADGISAVYTGLVPLIYKAQHSLLNGLILGFAGDLILIGVGMVLLTRNWSAGLLLILPSLFPLAVVFGGMGLLGFVVDTGIVMTPAVALGVTVDDAIHFMLWCRHGQERGSDRRGSIMYAYHDCARAIYQSWGVIGLGLSCFALSSFMPTRRFGYLMFLMLSFSSIGNLVFLPALLASPAGRYFWRRRVGREDAARAARPGRTFDRRGKKKSADLPLASATPPEEVARDGLATPIQTPAGTLHLPSDVPHRSHRRT